MQNTGIIMGISKVVVNEYVTCACSAILKLCIQVIKWPNEEERKNISALIQKMHGFINCVGLIDGTLFYSSFGRTLNAEHYYN